MIKKGITSTVIGLLALVAIMAGIYVSQHVNFNKKEQLSTNFNGTLLQSPREISDFSLMGSDGKPFDKQSLQGKWTLMFFGFTNCGYLCPTTMAELGKAYRILEKKGIKPLPHVVMVSIDPQRDSLEKLQTYVQSFDPHFYGARGEESVIQDMAKEMGVAYLKVFPKQDDKQDYDLQHSGTVLLFNPDGQLEAFFTNPKKTDLLVEDYVSLVS